MNPLPLATLLDTCLKNEWKGWKAVPKKDKVVYLQQLTTVAFQKYKTIILEGHQATGLSLSQLVPIANTPLKDLFDRVRKDESFKQQDLSLKIFASLVLITCVALSILFLYEQIDLKILQGVTIGMASLNLLVAGVIFYKFKNIKDIKERILTLEGGLYDYIHALMNQIYIRDGVPLPQTQLNVPDEASSRLRNQLGVGALEPIFKQYFVPKFPIDHTPKLAIITMACLGIALGILSTLGFISPKYLTLAFATILPAGLFFQNFFMKEALLYRRDNCLVDVPSLQNSLIKRYASYCHVDPAKIT